MNEILLYIALGLAAGFISGMVGIGGGIILVPALVFLVGLSQHQAQGTTLALLVPPIGIFAAWAYWKQGYVDIKIALFICLGFILGSILGANASLGIPEGILRKVFGLTLFLISLKMFFS